MAFRRLMWIAGLLLCISLVPARGFGQATASADSAKRDGIRRILALQKTDSLMLVGIEQGIAQEPADPNLPPNFMAEFSARMRRDIGQFTDRLIPVYDSLYTAAEVKQMLAWYETPLGKRMLETQPVLADAVMTIAHQWGMEVAGLVLVDMARAGKR